MSVGGHAVSYVVGFGWWRWEHLRQNDRYALSTGYLMSVKRYCKDLFIPNFNTVALLMGIIYAYFAPPVYTQQSSSSKSATTDHGDDE